MDAGFMGHLDTEIDNSIKKLRNATTGIEIRTFITEYEELMMKKSIEITKTIIEASI